MFLSVREMEVRKVEFDTAFRPGEIEFFEKHLRQTTDLQVTGSAELIESTEEVRVQGHVGCRFEADCDRCLETAVFPVDQEFDLFYRPTETENVKPEREIDSEEAEIGYYEGGGLELEDILREQILLVLPMQYVCSEGCKGICPVCGQNRNSFVCNCKEVP
ncbi:MAG: DUF177 domain-containing protein, partial [Acidobacteria bacterium]|nr:DUF177 domain-containing protein [Acidobacteriota bacterium]